MSKYASLLFAPEEYYEIGPFRFPIYHDLVPGEARGLERLSKKESRHTFNSIKLAKKIADDKGITTKAAVELLSETGEDKQEIFYEYATELEELQVASVGVVDAKIDKATLLIQFRGEVKTNKSKDWQKVEDWTEADTEKIPGKLLDKIVEFMEWERTEWPSSEGNEDQQEFSPPRNNN